MSVNIIKDTILKHYVWAYDERYNSLEVRSFLFRVRGHSVHYLPFIGIYYGHIKKVIIVDKDLWEN